MNFEGNKRGRKLGLRWKCGWKSKKWNVWKEEWKGWIWMVDGREERRAEGRVKEKAGSI